MNVNKAASSIKKALPSLWVMVQRITEEQWRQLKAFSEVYGKGSLQFRLIELLRSMKVYDAKAERQAFSENDLYSLRKKAKRWLIRTGRRLAFAIKEVEEQYGDVEMLISWGHFADAWEFVAEAKVVAMAREEFVVMAGLLEQEKNIAKELFQYEERTLELTRIANETLANAEKIRLAAKMLAFSAMHIEPVRNKLAKTGLLDDGAVTDYFSSEVHCMDIDSLPISLQIEKLAMDEFFYYISGNYNEAISKALETVQMLKKHPSMMAKEPDKLAKEFQNLAAFYTMLNQMDGLIWIISEFEECLPWSEENREHQYLRYIHTLFGAALDFSLPWLAQKGLQAWESHSDFVIALPESQMRSVTLLCICWSLLSQEKTNEARQLYNKIKTPPLAMPRLLYQIMMVVLHLVLMFEEGDGIGLKSTGLQYRRKMLKLVPSNSTVLSLISFLRSKDNLLNIGWRKKSLLQLAVELRRSQSQDSDQRIIWHDPILMWIENALRDQ
jgi:hypothetical protein